MTSWWQLAQTSVIEDFDSEPSGEVLNIGLWQSAHARPLPTALTLPALLMAGDQDQATPAPLAEELSRLMPNARFALLAGCAHVPQLQDPDRIAAEINAFG